MFVAGLPGLTGTAAGIEQLRRLQTDSAVFCAIFHHAGNSVADIPHRHLLAHRLFQRDAGRVDAFHVGETSLQQLFAVADAGRLMPPKSTWFEPKLRSGLFIHEIEQ